MPTGRQPFRALSDHLARTWHAQRREVLLDDDTLLALTTEPALCRLTLPSGALQKLPLPPVAAAEDLRLARLDDENLALGTPDAVILLLDPEPGSLRQRAAAVPGMLDCTAPVQLTATGHLLQSCVTEPSGDLAAIAAARSGPTRRIYATVSPEAQRVLGVREPTTLAPREVWRGPAPDHLPFLPIAFVRQSTQSRIETNTEGRRRQYELVEVARRRAFRAVEVIDEDLGRSASGMVGHPGFERLVAARAPGRSAPSSASVPPCFRGTAGSRATAAIGITCSSALAWSRPG